MEQTLQYKSTKDMSKEDWLKFRKDGIGASEIGSVLGFNQYETPFQVWQDKTTPQIIEKIETPAMKRGKRLEEVVAEEYEAATGNKVRRDNKYRIHPTLPFLFASLDRTIVDKGDGRGPGVLECKTVSFFAKKTWEEEIPVYYYAQLQQQLAVSGYKWGEIALFVADTFDLTILPFERDEKFIETMENLASKFWNENVVGKVPPSLELPDYEKLFSDKEKTIEATPVIVDLIKKLNSVKQEVFERKTAIESAEDQIKTFLGENTALLCCDNVLATWKTISKKSYTVEATQYRQLRIKK